LGASSMTREIQDERVRNLNQESVRDGDCILYLLYVEKVKRLIEEGRETPHPPSGYSASFAWSTM
jgi:hypothetical protein